MLGEEYNACSSALCNFLHSPLISYLLAPNIFLRTLFSNTLNLFSSLNVRDQDSQRYNTAGNIIVLYVEESVQLRVLVKSFFLVDLNKEMAYVFERSELIIWIKHLERYLELREMKLQENGKSYIMLSYMHCILLLTELES